MNDFVAAFLEGMYYAGKMPSRREVTDIAMHLVKHRLKGIGRLAVEQVISSEMNALHLRYLPALCAASRDQESEG